MTPRWPSMIHVAAGVCGEDAKEGEISVLRRITLVWIQQKNGLNKVTLVLIVVLSLLIKKTYLEQMVFVCLGCVAALITWWPGAYNAAAGKCMFIHPSISPGLQRGVFHISISFVFFCHRLWGVRGHRSELPWKTNKKHCGRKTGACCKWWPLGGEVSVGAGGLQLFNKRLFFL